MARIHREVFKMTSFYIKNGKLFIENDTDCVFKMMDSIQGLGGGDEALPDD